MAGEHPTVVVVDNNQDYLRSVAWFFQEAGMQVVCLVSGSASGIEELASQVMRHSPDIVLTGVRNINNLDDRDTSGIDLASALRQQRIKVLIASTPDYAEKAGSLGFPFTEKGLGAENLVGQVQALLGIVDVE